MNVLALDLSLTSTGVALPDGTALTLSPRQRGVERLAWYRETILAIAAGPHADGMPTAAADLVVIEEYAFSRAAAHSHELGELGGVIRLALADHGQPWVAVNPSALKRYATGKGNASKNDMLLAAVKRLGYDGSCNDEADALWLRAMALDHYNLPVVVMPEANRDSLTKVAWPVLEREATADAPARQRDLRHTVVVDHVMGDRRVWCQCRPVLEHAVHAGHVGTVAYVARRLTPEPVAESSATVTA